MENKENNMLKENQDNIDSKIEIDITAEEITEKPDSKSLSLIKKIVLFLVGCAGIYIASLLAALFLFGSTLPEDSKNAIITFVTYTILFIALAGIVNVDVKKLIIDFKKWKSWLIGIGFAAAMILFPIIYTAIVSLFYQYHVNENESSLRSIISIYPVLSIIIFGMVGPLCEELTYRVGLFGSLIKVKWLAYTVSIIVFAMMHFSFTSPNIYDELVNLPSYLVSGALMAIAYDKFGLAASLSAHMINNLYAVIVSIATKNM